MIPEVGHFALICALAGAIVAGVLPIAGAASGRSRLMALARPAARAQFVLVAIAFGCLACVVRQQRFLGAERRRQFELGTAAALSLRRDVGSHEGSLLLWTLMLSGWSCAVTLFHATCRADARPRACGDGAGSAPASCSSCCSRRTRSSDCCRPPPKAAT